MGEPYYYVYRIFKEPGHQLIAEGSARDCKAALGMAQGFDYFARRIRAGKDLRYSIEAKKSTELGLGKRVPYTHDSWNGGARKDLATVPNRIEMMCGECAYFKSGKRVEGKLLGMCMKSMEIVERCDWCTEEEEHERHVGKAAAGT